MANDFCVNCPTDCNDLVLPAIEVNQLCIPELRESEVCGIYFLPAGATGPADWTQAADWTAVIDNTDVLNANVKYLVVEGDVPEPEFSTQRVSRGRSVDGIKTYTLNATIKATTDLHYLFIKALQCGNADFKIWYETLGGRLFGGQNGIELTLVRASAPLDRGADGFERFEIVLQYRAYCEPERIENPNA